MSDAVMSARVKFQTAVDTGQGLTLTPEEVGALWDHDEQAPVFDVTYQNPIRVTDNGIQHLLTWSTFTGYLTKHLAAGGTTENTPTELIIKLPNRTIKIPRI